MRTFIRLISVIFVLLIGNAAVSQGVKQNVRETVSFSQPVRNGQLDCAPDAGAIYHCVVSGKLSNMPPGRELLLWVRPVQPPSESEGWYLQRRPNGVLSHANDSWNGRVQIGNRDYPPHDGDIVDVAVSIVDKSEFDRLMKETGVAIKTDPTGTAVVKTENVRLRISARR